MDDDPLTVEPFKSYADKLRAAGLVTLDGIAALPYGLDATITPPVTRWLRRVAELGMAIAQDDDLKDWAITLASKLAARGIASQDEARATAGLADKVIKDLSTFASPPDEDDLRAWLTTPTPPPVVVP